MKQSREASKPPRALSEASEPGVSGGETKPRSLKTANKARNEGVLPSLRPCASARGGHGLRGVSVALSGRRTPAPEARQKIGPGVSPGSPIPRGPSPSGATESSRSSRVARADCADPDETEEALEAGIRDVIEYYYRGTLPRAFQALFEQAGSKGEEANKQIKKAASPASTNAEPTNPTPTKS